MTIKLKAPRAYFTPGLYVTPYRGSRHSEPVRIVRESDWRKLMKLVRAIEEYDGDGDAVESIPADVWKAYDALKGAKL